MKKFLLQQSDFYVSGIIMAGVFALSFAKPMAVNAMMG